MRYVEEVSLQNAEDLEAGGLMNDVDEMLGEEDSSDAEGRDRDDPTAIALSRSKLTRASVDTTATDNWEGTISDFGGDDEDRDQDPLGLGLPMVTIEERPVGVTFDKRMD
jgi:hypothetical protein